MGIAPVKLCDCACQGDRSGRVKLRRQRMMREHGGWHEKQTHARNQNS
jgi:hypothetical protein